MIKWLKVTDKIKDDILISVSGPMGDQPPTFVNVHIGEDQLTFTWDDWKELVPLVMQLAQEWAAANRKSNASL